MAETPARARPLFGGAFSATLPVGAVDASALRPVPDHQEVFCHRACAQSLVLELLQLQGHVRGEAAARYHFQDLGDTQDAEAVLVEAVRPLPLENLALKDCCQEAWLLSGQQRVAKENQQEAKTVTMHQALLRLPQYQTDILLTFNQPPPDNMSSLGPENMPPPPWSLVDFEQMVNTLTLHDPNIFGTQ